MISQVTKKLLFSNDGGDDDDGNDGNDDNDDDDDGGGDGENDDDDGRQSVCSSLSVSSHLSDTCQCMCVQPNQNDDDFGDWRLW